MSQNITIVCGVPAAGKSWVCERLKDSYDYLPHDGWLRRSEISGDDYLKEYAQRLVQAAKTATKPVLADCPFAESKLRSYLEEAGEHPTFVFLKVSPEDLSARYVERQKPLPKGHVTRIKSIPARAKEWDSFYGTSDEVLLHLRNPPTKRLTPAEWRKFNRE